MPVKPTARQSADRREVVRVLLRKYPDGLTDKEIAKRVNIKTSMDRLNLMLAGMGDAYIDRWMPGTPRWPWRPVWCVVDVPPHCPRPDEV